MRWLALATVVLLGGCAAPAGSNQASSAAENPGMLNVADAAIAGGDPAMALKVSQSVLAADPHNLEALYHEAAAYYAVDRCEDAIAAYKLALGIDPHSSPAETGIGRCLLKRNAAEAEQAFAAAVADDPGNASAQNDLGIARDLNGDFAGATGPYQQALLLSPGNTATEVNLGLSLALSGDADDALQYLGPLANGTGATAKIREDYATALLAAGRGTEARQVLAVDMPPGQADAAIATLASLIGQPPLQAPAAATAPPETPTPVAAAAPMVTTPLAPPPAPIASAAPAPMLTPTRMASAAPQPQADPAPPAETAQPSANASLPLADSPPLTPSQPTAPTAVVALVPAISAPQIIAPPAPALAPPARHVRPQP